MPDENVLTAEETENAVQTEETIQTPQEEPAVEEEQHLQTPEAEQPDGEAPEENPSDETPADAAAVETAQNAADEEKPVPYHQRYYLRYRTGRRSTPMDLYGTKTFLQEHRLDPVSSKARPGDLMLVQFAHNDENEKSRSGMCRFRPFGKTCPLSCVLPGN